MVAETKQHHHQINYRFLMMKLLWNVGMILILELTFDNRCRHGDVAILAAIDVILVVSVIITNCNLWNVLQLTCKFKWIPYIFGHQIPEQKRTPNILNMAAPMEEKHGGSILVEISNLKFEKKGPIFHGFLGGDIYKNITIEIFLIFKWTYLHQHKVKVLCNASP